MKKNSPESKIMYYSVENQNKAIYEDMILAGYDLLGLIRYFTVGRDEVRSWTIRKNTKAP